MTLFLEIVRTLAENCGFWSDDFFLRSLENTQKMAVLGAMTFFWRSQKIERTLRSGPWKFFKMKMGHGYKKVGNHWVKNFE